MEVDNKMTFNSNRNNSCIIISQEDEIKMILQLLAKIEYEQYLEIKEKMNSPLIVRNECRILSITAVNSAYFYQVA
jgi:hypothetical protein